MRIARISILSLMLTLLLASMLMPHVVSAQRLFPSIVPNCDQNLIKNSSTGKYSTDKECNFGDFIQMFVNLFDWGLAILSVLSVTFIIIGGIILLIAAGNENRIKTGKAIVVNTVIGIIIALGSWLIINTVIGILVGNGSIKDVKVFGQTWWGTPSCGENYVSCSKFSLKKGCGDTTGSYVEELQRKLNNAPGCQQISVDGCFGPETESAVRAFNIAALGSLKEANPEVADSLTWQALNDGKSCVIQQHTVLPRAATAAEASAGNAGCCVTTCATQGMENTPQTAADGQGCKDLIPDAKWYSGSCHIPDSQTADGCCQHASTGECYDNGNKDWCVGAGSYWSGQTCASMQSRCAIINQCE